MKILFAGGGTGGHFYPIIAVARQIRKIAEDERLVSIDFLFVSDNPINKPLLDFEGIRYREIKTGKMRNYASASNITDIIKTFFALVRALIFMYGEMPDVVFSKGGYASFPVLFAARVYGIPVVIHESDSIPGKVNLWASKFARRIAISFPEAAEYFPKEKTALTGNPIRGQLMGGNKEESRIIFGLEERIPTILVLGGSQGARTINEILVNTLPEVLEYAQIIHQTGENNFDDTIKEAAVMLQQSRNKSRYHVYPFLEEDVLRSAAAISNVIVSRAGGTAIFEIAAWGIPSILIPLPLSAKDHQRENAYNYARAGGCEVIEEANLTPHILASEIRRLLEDTEKINRMRASAQAFARLDAAEEIAREIIKLGFHA